MAAYPDRDTLRLRAPDRRTPAQAVELARRELAATRRPLAPTRADVGLSPADRRLASFRERYPAVAERFHPAVLYAVAHGPGPQPAGQVRRPCAWCMARVRSRRPDVAAPRVDQLGRLLLGDPCPACQAALGWRPPRPKPKPRPRPAARSRKPAARTATSTRTRTSATSARSSAGRPLDPAAERAGVAAYVLGGAGAPAGLSRELAAANAATMRRLGMDPASAPHLTRVRP